MTNRYILYLHLSCPSCGGEIEFDEKMKFGFCMFCGTKIMNEAAIPKTVIIDNSAQVANCLQKAKDPYECGDFASMLNDVDKAPEIDSTVPDGWFFKDIAFLNLGVNLSSAKHLSSSAVRA